MTEDCEKGPLGDLLRVVDSLIEMNDVPGSAWHLPDGHRAPLLEARRAICLHSGRVDGPYHSWRFDGDDPLIICVFCDETRDAQSGREIRPLLASDSKGQ